MTIDIEPHETREANALERIMMENYHYNELYYFKRDTGEESVKWPPHMLLDFCPRYTVSEWIENVHLNAITTWTHATKCWSLGIHPTWINTERYQEWSEKIASLLSEPYARRTAKHIIESSKQTILNPWKFVKIVRKK